MRKRRVYVAGDRSLHLLRWAVQPPAMLIKAEADYDLVQNRPWEWETVRRLRVDAQRAAESLYGKPWKRLYREGYRCNRVQLGGIMIDPNQRPRVGTRAWIKKVHLS